ncbi:MAG: DUF4199 domain-containing protein [Bacteroidetes bacterium]|nr:MAG: DUF4199 domain-containing protein [Bacteroidota bacterium]REK07623.1 MAG: DUF4199 domain-containing protein [Bacteroidota bacterium]REK36945.1 MAG: DUF4199 domain-containing protein [Bacteroidota bacterium]REK47765.1 MAG: DUF4199 domain-containing protein [Bacteroidota bacterium]
MDTTLKFKDTSVFIKTALICALGMAVYFLIMKAAGFANRVELHFLNIFIMFWGIRYVLLRARNDNNGRLDYLPGLTSGFLTALMTAIFFAVFIFIYFSYLDNAMLLSLQSELSFGQYVTPGALVLMIVLEGGASGAILSFALIHLLNREKIRRNNLAE